MTTFAEWFANPSKSPLGVLLKLEHECRYVLRNGQVTPPAQRVYGNNMQVGDYFYALPRSGAEGKFMGTADTPHPYDIVEVYGGD